MLSIRIELYNCKNIIVLFRMKKAVFILFVLLLPGMSSAKKLDSLQFSNHKEIYLDWDNDIFVSTDHYYSQGLHLFWSDPVFRKNPLNHVMLRLNNADNYFGIGLVQEMYTPKDIVDTLLNNVDRPYAGTLFVRSFIVSSHPEKSLKLTTQFDLGLLGPLSGAGDAQRLIHEWTGSTPPGGWDFQIDNRPYINYNVLIEHGIISTPYFEFDGLSRIRVGNIHDDFKVGIALRTGWLNNYFNGLHLANRKYTKNKTFEFKLLGGLNMNLIAYNATLMGGMIPPESSQQFDFKEIENFVIDIYGGIKLVYKTVGLQGKLSWKTKEFETGDDHGWGTVALFFRF